MDMEDLQENIMFFLKFVHTEEEALDILRQELRARINKVKKNIHTLEDVLKFLYSNDISIDAAGKGDDYCVWEERIAVRELVKEICGIDLGRIRKEKEMSFGIYNAFIFDRNYTMQELIKMMDFLRKEVKKPNCCQLHKYVLENS